MHERRIGERRPLRPTPVVCGPSEADGVVIDLTGDEACNGYLVDVSVTGAAVVVVGCEVAHGEIMSVRLQHGRFEGAVRRVAETEQADAVLVGLEFVRLDPAVETSFHEHLGAGRPSHERWLSLQR